jgi:hydroxymethylglutaryl-CoA reductase (NADPH)
MNTEQSIEQIVSDVKKGQAKMHHLDRERGVDEAISIRQKVVKEVTDSQIQTISDFSMDASQAALKNCENMIGATQVPLGVAGPLRIDGEYAKGEYMFPLATTEGVLVAAVNRGCRASMLSGGVKTLIRPRGITRAPVFKVESIRDGQKFIRWVEEHFARIQEQVASTDRHISLRKITPWLVGRNVFLRFVFDTSDAMGMNMAVVACDNVIKNIIHKETNARCISVSGNLCSDKKPTAINFITGRGISVNAEVVISKEHVREVLKAEPEQIIEVNTAKNHIGSAMAGSYGFNAHYANIVAAMFIATGQDPAHVVEGSNGITTAEVTEMGDLYFSVYLPSLILGAIGGGTGLDTQREALQIIGIDVHKDNPGENVRKLAEVVASAVLAGELSLISALASHDLAKAHVVYGRNKQYEV